MNMINISIESSVGRSAKVLTRESVREGAEFPRLEFLILSRLLECPLTSYEPAKFYI